MCLVLELSLIMCLVLILSLVDGDDESISYNSPQLIRKD